MGRRVGERVFGPIDEQAGGRVSGGSVGKSVGGSVGELVGGSEGRNVGKSVGGFVGLWTCGRVMGKRVSGMDCTTVYYAALVALLCQTVLWGELVCGSVGR